MSTAKIEAALRILEAYAVLTPDVAKDTRDVVADARAELTAIRQAAKGLEGFSATGRSDRAMRQGDALEFFARLAVEES